MLFCDITLEPVYCIFRFYMASLGHAADSVLNLCIYMSVYCIFWEENKHLTFLINHSFQCGEHVRKQEEQTGETTMNCTECKAQ